MTDTTLENVDILIVGAGPVGMTLHLALAAGGQKSLLLDGLKWIDWEQFDSKLLAYYSNSGEGQPPYPPRILLKLEFLGYLYGIGRRALIERATCDLHWKYFLGLPIDAALPDHSTLSYFRSRLGAEGFQEILDALILQAREHVV